MKRKTGVYPNFRPCLDRTGGVRVRVELVAWQVFVGVLAFEGAERVHDDLDGWSQGYERECQRIRPRDGCEVTSCDRLG